MWVVALATLAKLSIAAFKLQGFIWLQWQVFFLFNGWKPEAAVPVYGEQALPAVVLLPQSYLPSQGRFERTNPKPFCVISLSAAASSVLSMNAGKRAGSVELKLGSYQSCCEPGRKKTKKQTPCWE